MFYVLLFSFFISSKNDYLKSLVTLMGPILMAMAFILVFVAYRGPMFFWFKLWTSDPFRIIFFMVLFLTFFRGIHVNIIAGRKWSERGSIASAGIVSFVFGLQLFITGLAIQIAGFESTLSTINDELLIFPGGLSGRVGIATHLGVPLKLPLYTIIFSLLVLIFGGVLFIFNRKRPGTVQRLKRR